MTTPFFLLGALLVLFLFLSPPTRCQSSGDDEFDLWDDAIIDEDIELGDFPEFDDLDEEKDLTDEGLDLDDSFTSDFDSDEEDEEADDDDGVFFDDYFDDGDDDDDEDEDGYDNPDRTDPSESDEDETPKRQVKFFNWPEQDHYYYEILFGSILLTYLVVYFIGSAKNTSIVEDVFEAATPVLRRQFPERFRPTKNSAQESIFFATGRKNVKGLLAIVTTAPRHDIFKWLYAKLFSPVDCLDRLTVQIAFFDSRLGTIEPCCLSVIRDDLLETLQERYDVKVYCPVTNSSNMFGIEELNSDSSSKHDLVCVTDSPDYTSRLLDARRIDSILAHRNSIIQFDLTDSATDLYPNEQKCLQLTFALTCDDSGHISIPPIRDLLNWSLAMSDRATGKPNWWNGEDEERARGCRMGRNERDRNGALRKKRADAARRKREEERRKQRKEELEEERKKAGNEGEGGEEEDGSGVRKRTTGKKKNQKKKGSKRKDFYTS